MLENLEKKKTEGKSVSEILPTVSNTSVSENKIGEKSLEIRVKIFSLLPLASGKRVLGIKILKFGKNFVPLLFCMNVLRDIVALSYF